MLRPVMERYDSFLVTEKTTYQLKAPVEKTYFLKQVNRKELSFLPRMAVDSFRSVRLFHREKPDLVISTGALATIPVCLLAKLHRKKLIYIESFARSTSASLTGKLLYRFADQFYVQWEQMLQFYPNAIFLGGIF